MNKSLDAIFRPNSIAVIGASTQRGTLGREIFDKLLGFEFNGPVYPVNPKANFIHSVRAYPRISDIADEVDLAVVVVRKELVHDVVRQCAEKGVKGVVVITAGFKETGADGAKAEQELAAMIAENGMRMVGPNCMGVINTAEEIRLDATFAPTLILPGNIGLVSQSGALGQTILEHANELNLGVSMFASIGNKADVSGNDLLEYWHDDDSVEVILMYLESFGNARKFMQLAKQVSQRKPIVIVKSGRTSAGARAASSHTGALAGTDLAYDALFKQSGVVRANTINEMFDFAMGFAHMPLPAGNRVAIISNAGGPGIMAADACESFGLEVIPLQEKTKAELRKVLVPDASLNNPVDLLAGAQPAEFKAALGHILKDEQVDAAIVIFVAPIITDPMAVATEISDVAKDFDKPVLGCFMGVKGVATGVKELHRRGLPAYPFPETAARTLAAMHQYRQWLQRGVGEIKEHEVDLACVRSVISKVKQEGREQLELSEILEILERYRIPFVQSGIASDLTELTSIAEQCGFPVALKVASIAVVHKSDVGGVKLNLGDAEELAEAYEQINQTLQQKGLKPDDYTFVVQEMLGSGGREIILGIHAEAAFGPMVMFGLGGIHVEVLKDIAFRFAPLSDKDIDEMIHSIKGLPILQGIRGEPPVDFEVIRELLHRLSQLAVNHPEIAEVDLNPFMTYPDRADCKCVDARIRIADVWNA